MLYRLAAAVLVLLAGTAAYFGVHYAGTVLADDPPDEGKSAVERAAEADLAKPLQDGVVNGISIVPDATTVTASDFDEGPQDTQATVRTFPGTSPCTDANPPTAAPVDQSGELNFSYPADWELLDEWATACGDTAMSLYREMELASDPLADILVMRWRRTTSVELVAAADRVSAVTVSGKMAAHIEPVRTESGMAIGPDQLVVTEPWGLTTVVVWETKNSLSAQAVYEAISGATPTSTPSEETEL